MARPGAEVSRVRAQVRGGAGERDGFGEGVVVGMSFDSPLEERMASALMYWGRFVELDPDAPFLGIWDGWRIGLQTQVPVGPYRVDFMMRPVGWGSGWSLVLEVDGHDWHEKTKEQAAHDKKRDRFLVAEGHRVMRFTGSEVHRDPLQCAFEACKVAMDLQRATVSAEDREMFDYTMMKLSLELLGSWDESDVEKMVELEGT